MRKKPKEEKEPKTTKQLGVQVDKDQWNRFKGLAYRQGRTAGDLLKEALEEYLEKHGSGDK